MTPTILSYKRVCGVNFEWYPIDETSTLHGVNIIACAAACQDDESCEYFRWHKSEDIDSQVNIGNCSLFGTNHQAKLTYCIKKGILCQSCHNYEYYNYNNLYTHQFIIHQFDLNFRCDRRTSFSWFETVHEFDLQFRWVLVFENRKCAVIYNDTSCIMNKFPIEL